MFLVPNLTWMFVRFCTMNLKIVTSTTIFFDDYCLIDEGLKIPCNAKYHEKFSFLNLNYLSN